MKNKGFTIVEFLVAMGFFSFILLLIFVGFIQINRSYTKGLVVKDVQNSTRNLVEDIARTIRNSSSVDQIIIDPSGYRLCIGDTRYAWNQYSPAPVNGFTNETYSTSSEVIKIAKAQDAFGCTAPIEQNSSAQLIDDNQIIQHLNIERIGTSNSYTITAVVSSYLYDDFETFGEDASCKVRSGDQYCALAKIETTVTARN